jgi:hypothetical protein
MSWDNKQIDAHANAYNVRSPQVKALWLKFQQSKRLTRLFPAIASVADFWRTIKATMGYFGYQSVSKNKQDNLLVGKFKNGEGRTRKHPSVRFVGWLCRADSGSEFFRGNFDLILESVRDRLAFERLKALKDGHHTDPKNETLEQDEALGGMAA